ncbi:MAG: hypothetical protein ACXWEY_11480 [Bacteroidia bacterium]
MLLKHRQVYNTCVFPYNCPYFNIHVNTIPLINGLKPKAIDTLFN